jgi:hypothetical protein
MIHNALNCANWPAARGGRVSERAHFVLLSDQGYSPSKIGELMGYEVATIRTWLHAYQAQGVAGLQDAPRSGRPCKEKLLTGIVQAQASQPPPNFGYFAGLLDHRLAGDAFGGSLSDQG